MCINALLVCIPVFAHLPLQKLKEFLGRRNALTQTQLNDIYLGPEFEIAARMGVLLNTIFACSLYSAPAPVFNLIASATFFLAYWVRSSFPPLPPFSPSPDIPCSAPHHPHPHRVGLQFPIRPHFLPGGQNLAAETVPGAANVQRRARGVGGAADALRHGWPSDDCALGLQCPHASSGPHPSTPDQNRPHQVPFHSPLSFLPTVPRSSRSGVPIDARLANWFGNTLPLILPLPFFGLNRNCRAAFPTLVYLLVVLVALLWLRVLRRILAKFCCSKKDAEIDNENIPIFSNAITSDKWKGPKSYDIRQATSFAFLCV